ncbi:MAG TPA: CotH kinase family protein, partial [Saprospiraceae bacterium]|nr:CotH kinase family protein [Saprospiraceae bacterium]
MKFTITRAVVVLALFVSGSVAGIAQNNALFGTDHIPELKLTIRQSNWMHVLDSMKLQGEGMIVGSAEIDGIKYPNVGIRYRGQSSYTYSGDKNPYQLELNYIHPDQNHQGYRSLTLSNALRDPSYLREYLGFSIAGQYMNTPKANFIHLYVNNDYAGIYVGIEPVDADYLERRTGDAWTALFKCSPE